MIMHSTRSNLSRPLAAAVLALALVGCGTMQRGGTPGGEAPAQSGQWAAQVRDVIADLNRGDAVAARRKLTAILRRRPDNGIARQLLAQIDTDPRVLLGTESYSYTLRPGETLSTVAGRALGNPMLFYALARYNNIAVPASVVPGQTIQVPGRRPAPPTPRAPAPARPEPRAPARPPRATPPQTLAPAPRPAAPRANPAQAARLRAQGLAALNAGSVDRAVALLRQAAALDPGNAAIRSDLGRAQRIQSTVRSRR
jgi:LysM domain